MTETYLVLEDKKFTVKCPHSLNEYLNRNSKRVEAKDVKYKELFDSLAPLIPIGIAIAGGAIATWAISREQKEHIMREFL